ncbi:unnamed protein product [marine sediment metagenome]|uniref:Uncharacterized protein n=1 Tax=marine sediment metagenome TaxID=412755 RepID=X1L6G1_9ZZZZ
MCLRFLWEESGSRIAVYGSTHLDSLATAILDAYGFDYDHLCIFSYKNRFGRVIEVSHSYME